MVCVCMQPGDARRAFPCWDEPLIKATFDATLVVPKNLLALSNMVSVDTLCSKFYHVDSDVCTVL